MDELVQMVVLQSGTHRHCIVAFVLVAHARSQRTVIILTMSPWSYMCLRSSSTFWLKTRCVLANTQSCPDSALQIEAAKKDRNKAIASKEEYKARCRKVLA